MITESKKIIFKTASVVFDDELALKLAKEKKYDSLTILSYNDLDLAGFSETRKKTPVIHLDKKTPEDILAGFNSTVRNEVRKTFKINELDFVEGPQYFDDAYELYKKFEYGQGRTPFSKKEMRAFRPFVAYFKKQPVSLMFCYDIFPFLRARSICSLRMETEDKEMYRMIAYASRRLVFEICRYGWERGYKWFDLGSINLESANKSSIALFKSFFKGEIIEEHTYFYKTALFHFFEKFVKIKLVIFNLFKI